MLRGTYGVIPNIQDSKVSPNREVFVKIDKKKTNLDEDILYCAECKRCYEFIRNNKTKRITTEYYNDFPIYGKEKKTCPECKVSKGLENV